MSKISFYSYVDDVQREMTKHLKGSISKATRFMKKQLISETTKIFGADSGLVKGIGHKNLQYSAMVGFGPPAFHAHLIEFGTDTRFAKRGRGSGPKGTGNITANPWVFRTFDVNALAVQKILQEAWF